MRNKLKLLGNLTFFLLMSAVVLRPVVVDASSNCPAGVGSSSLASCVMASALSNSGPLASQICKAFPRFSSLKLIPKETFSVGGLAPEFSKSTISPDSGLRLVARSVFHSLSAQKLLILRI